MRSHMKGIQITQQHSMKDVGDQHHQILPYIKSDKLRSLV